MINADRRLKSIYVENLDALLAKLKEIDPSAHRIFRRELRKQIKPVEQLAKSFVPAEVFPGWRDTKPYYPAAWGWATDTVHRGRTYGKTGESRWQWSQEQARSGISISNAKTKVQRIKGTTFGVTALALMNKSVPGIIYELAGSGSTRSKAKTRRVSRNPEASNLFIKRVNETSGTIASDGKGKRLIYKATAEKGEQALANIAEVLKKYLGKEFRG
jgi:hypothetical protein